MEFDVSFNKDRALADVRAQVDTARAELPPDVQQPVVQEISTSLNPVISVALSGDVPERTLFHLARDLSDELKTIPTVLDAQLSGTRDEMLEIVVDPAKLEGLRHHPAGDVSGDHQQQHPDRRRLDRHRPWQLCRQGARRDREVRRTC